MGLHVRGEHYTQLWTKYQDMDRNRHNWYNIRDKVPGPGARNPGILSITILLLNIPE